MFDCCCIDYREVPAPPARTLVFERPMETLKPVKRRVLFISTIRKAGATSLLLSLLHSNENHGRPLPTVKPYVEHVWRRKRGGWVGGEVSLVDVGRPTRVDLVADVSDDSISVRSSHSSRSSLFESAARGRVSLARACALASGVVLVVDSSERVQRALSDEQVRFAEGLISAVRLSTPNRPKKLMVVANKQDILDALAPSEVVSSLGLLAMSELDWICEPEVATQPHNTLDGVMQFFFPDDYASGSSDSTPRPRSTATAKREGEATAEALLSQ